MFFWLSKRKRLIKRKKNVINKKRLSTNCRKVIPDHVLEWKILNKRLIMSQTIKRMSKTAVTMTVITIAKYLHREKGINKNLTLIKEFSTSDLSIWVIYSLSLNKNQIKDNIIALQLEQKQILFLALLLLTARKSLFLSYFQQM